MAIKEIQGWAYAQRPVCSGKLDALPYLKRDELYRKIRLLGKPPPGSPDISCDGSRCLMFGTCFMYQGTPTKR